LKCEIFRTSEIISNKKKYGRNVEVKSIDPCSSMNIF